MPDSLPGKSIEELRDELELLSGKKPGISSSASGAAAELIGLAVVATVTLLSLALVVYAAKLLWDQL